MHTSDSGFACSQAEFQEIVHHALHTAQQLGASSAAASASEGSGMNVSVRMGELENVERSRDKSLGVTVYLGQQRGNASTSDFSREAIAKTVRAAYDIARFTAPDPFSGLADREQLVSPAEANRDLALFYPWDLDTQHALSLALECETAALGYDKRVTNSEGANVWAQQSHFYSAQMQGGETVFQGGYASSRHGISVSVIAQDPQSHDADGMQREGWFSSERDATKLEQPTSIGLVAAQRAVSHLGARPVATSTCPVLFEAPLAAGLLGAYVQAVSGGALYRQSSFLLDSLGKIALAEHIDIDEDPFILGARGSSPFDDEGVRVHQRRVAEAGRVATYFLSSYSARKLGMTTTGHAGGSHNLRLTSRLTQAGDNLEAMLKKLHRGFFVTELMGQGVNYVTGDYSRGAAGFWVENGEIQHPVQGVTIAGNMRDMLRDIVAVGADTFTYGAKTVGSLLISNMKLAGN
jgi:PmbA protein